MGSSNKKRDNVIGENDDIKMDVTDKMGGITIRQREKSDINSCKYECKKTYKCGNDNKACKRKCKGKCDKNYSECVEPCKTLSKNKKKQCIKDNGCKSKKKKCIEENKKDKKKQRLTKKEKKCKGKCEDERGKCRKKVYKCEDECTTELVLKKTDSWVGKIVYQDSLPCIAEHKICKTNCGVDN